MRVTSWAAPAMAAALCAAASARDGGGDGLYLLKLDKAVEGKQPLLLYLARRDGVFTGAWAAVKPHRFLPEPVDFSGLKAAGGGFSGEVKGSLQSRAWDDAQKDRAVPYAVKLECAVKDGAVTGAFNGTCGDAKAGGQVAGTQQPLPAGGAEERTKGFPNWRGPTCSGAARDSGLELHTRVEPAMLLWESEERTANGYHGRGTQKSGWIQGCYASPVIAYNRVYLFYCDPNGPTIDPNWMAQLDAIFKGDTKSGPFFKQCAEALKLTPEAWARKYSSIEADDVLTCLDGDTGKTLWRAAFVEKSTAVKHQGRGITIQSKLADQLTMCIGDGKAFFAGAAGRVYCLDAATGFPVWENTIPDYWEFCEKERAEYRKTRAVPMPHREQICAASIYAGGVFVNSDAGGYDKATGKHGGAGNGLVGYDAATGKLLWRVPKMLGRIVSPVRWTHKGRDYIISLDQEAVCLEPRSGKVLWKTPAPHGGGNTPAVDEDLLITTGNDTSGVTAFRITPESCAKLWEVDRMYPLNGYACPILWRGHLYFLSKNKGGAAIFVCVELAGGKVIATTPADGVGGCGSPVAGDGRLFTESGAEGVVVADLDPKNFRVTGKGETNVNFSCSTTPAYADGKLVVRCNVGVKCFDMRKTARRP